MMRVRDNVSTLLERAVAAGMVPGAAAAWGRGGEIEAHVEVGSASVRPRMVPVRPETRYDLASLTKPLVATSLFLLARRRKLLDLETRISEVLPESRGRAVGEVSVLQLLTHTGGLPAWDPLYALTGGDPTATLPTLLGLTPAGRPGEDVVYSCPGFILFGMLLERVLGRSLSESFAEFIAKPLGLAEELCYLPDSKDGPIAGGAATPTVERALLEERGRVEDVAFIPRPGSNLPDDGNSRFLGGVSGNAGLFGTCRGVFELAAEYLPRNSRLFTEEEVALTTVNFTLRLAGQSRGLGWQLASTKGCSAGAALHPTAFGHTGFTGTSLWIDPTTELIAVLLTNRHHPEHRGIDLHPLRRRYHQLIN